MILYQCPLKIYKSDAKKYPESDFPYTYKMETKGNIEVGGSISFTNMCLDLSNPDHMDKLLAHK